MTEVRTTSFRSGVVVDINNSVKVKRDDLGDIVEFLEVVFTFSDESGESNRSKVADSSFVGRRILDNFSAEVGRLNSAQVLLVGLACLLVSTASPTNVLTYCSRSPCIT
jgi:hypothetical protein